MSVFPVQAVDLILVSMFAMKFEICSSYQLIHKEFQNI